VTSGDHRSGGLRRRAGLLILAGVLVALGGCARQIVVERPADSLQRLWAARIERIGAWKRWRLEGRAAVRRGDEGWQAALVWEQRGSDTRIELSDPLGRRVARLEVGPGGVVLTARNREYRADSPEELMQEVLGWWLPVSGMRWWLLGIPQPGAPQEGLELDERGLAVRFRQSGWTLVYKQYDRWNGQWMPVRAEFTQSPVRVRLLVTRWELP